MRGVTQDKPLDPVRMLQILEGQIALVHHIMAYKDANPSAHVLYPRQVWRANVLAYFLGAVTKSQIAATKQLGGESFAAQTNSQSWQVKRSKRLSYYLRHNNKLSLGVFNDATFEDTEEPLQAFRWAPHKILAFLLGNSKSRFSPHFPSTSKSSSTTTFTALTGTFP